MVVMGRLLGAAAASVISSSILINPAAESA